MIFLSGNYAILFLDAKRAGIGKYQAQISQAERKAWVVGYGKNST